MPELSIVIARVVQGVPFEPVVFSLNPTPPILLSTEITSLQPQLFTCVWSFQIPLGLEVPCSGKTKARKSTNLAAAVLSVFQPLLLQVAAVEAF